MQKVPTPDLSPEVLASLTTLMQAQAQECIYIKAVADKMKEKVGRKLDFSVFTILIRLNSSIRTGNVIFLISIFPQNTVLVDIIYYR